MKSSLSIFEGNTNDCLRKKNVCGRKEEEFKHVCRSELNVRFIVMMPRESRLFPFNFSKSTEINYYYKR